MTQFEFFMTFYGLLLGLAVAELFGGFASILRERAPPRLGVILPLVGVIALIEIMATFIDAWMSLRGIGINMPQFAVPMLAVWSISCSASSSSLAISRTGRISTAISIAVVRGSSACSAPRTCC